jgi:2-amino-4-hydroxy-6-hydroxymethyldihydropteridine diphosphokinase
MKIVTVYLGLGSNHGDREGNLQKALSLLCRQGRLTALSSVYETEPWGYTSQPLFLNAVCAMETRMGAEELLELAQSVERELGRVATFRYGPRTLDVDILFYGDEVMEKAHLQIPHPGIPNRAFILVPFVEIAPDMIHPTVKKSIAELLENVPGKGGVSRWGTLSSDLEDAAGP